MHVGAEQSVRSRLRERVLEPRVRERILRAHVDEAVPAAGRVRGDRHRLDERERVALHEDAVLERSRLRLVGVAHEVVRLRLLLRDGLPLRAGRERGAAAAEQVRLGDLAHDTGRAELERAPQSPCSRRSRGTRRATPGSTPAAMRRRSRRPGSPACGSGGPVSGSWISRGSGPATVRSDAGARSQRPRHGDGCAPSGTSTAPLRRHARSVQTCSTSAGRSSSAMQRVERRDAVRVGGRDVEPARRVAERALAHPADAPLCGAQRGEEQVPALTVGARDAVAVRARPHRRRRRSPRARRRSAPRAGGGGPSYTASRRIAVALNSAVPDFGSVASIVSTFVATRSGKCRFMNARPGRRQRVVAHGRLDRAAARDDARARAVGDAVALAVGGCEQDRLAADVERRLVAAALHAGVVRLEPPPGREAQREVVVEQVDGRRVLDDLERRALLDDVVPQPAVDEELAGVVLVAARPLDAAELREPRVAHARVHGRERAQLVPHVLRGVLPRSWPIVRASS